MICPGCRGKQGWDKRQLNILLQMLDAKYVKKCTSWRTLKMNNPLGLLSWDPLASSYAYGGQNLIHSAYEAR